MFHIWFEFIRILLVRIALSFFSITLNFFAIENNWKDPKYIFMSCLVMSQFFPKNCSFFTFFLCIPNNVLLELLQRMKKNVKQERQKKKNSRGSKNVSIHIQSINLSVLHKSFSIDFGYLCWDFHVFFCRLLWYCTYVRPSVRLYVCLSRHLFLPRMIESNRWIDGRIGDWLFVFRIWLTHFPTPRRPLFFLALAFVWK